MSSLRHMGHVQLVLSQVLRQAFPKTWSQALILTTGVQMIFSEFSGVGVVALEVTSAGWVALGKSS